jgi:4-hydroxy-3-methylbut-2-enyl diphosphate reductase
MEELLQKFGGQVKSLSFGDKVKGKVLEITPKRVIVDIGGKSEGLVAEKAYNEAESYIKTLKVGDEITASVIVPETPEGFIILSLREATRNTIWKKLEKSFKDKTPIKTLGKLVTNAGMIVDINGLNAFIPKSHLGKKVSKNPHSLIGRNIEVVVIDLDRSNNKIVSSEKLVSEKEEIKLIRKALKSVKRNEVYKGVVKSIYDFGCFVETQIKVGSGKDKKTVPLEGLVHISELSWDKVNHPSDVVKVGDKINVKIIAKEKDKPVLSMKQAKENPWDNIDKKYKKDTRLKGKVTRITGFGIFVALESGLVLTEKPVGYK